MTQLEIKEYLREGYKVRHRFFDEDEWVMLVDDVLIEYESGVRIPETEFWALYTAEHFQKDWEYIPKPKGVGRIGNTLAIMANAFMFNASPIPSFPDFGPPIPRAHRGKRVEPVRTGEKETPRNAKCPCGSEKKYKHCCKN